MQQVNSSLVTFSRMTFGMCKGSNEIILKVFVKIGMFAVRANNLCRVCLKFFYPLLQSVPWIVVESFGFRNVGKAMYYVSRPAIRVAAGVGLSFGTS